MRIQFPVPSTAALADATARPALERAIRSTGTGPAAPWQTPQSGRPAGPLAAQGVGRRPSNAPRRRAY